MNTIAPRTGLPITGTIHPLDLQVSKRIAADFSNDWSRPLLALEGETRMFREVRALAHRYLSLPKI